MKNLVEELRWRGLFHDMMPGTEEQLIKEATTAYIGFDPTADSLHIGSMVQIMLLVHLKNFGHQPIALVGGATGMIGDPSGKSDERNLLDEATLNKNVEGIKGVLSCFLDFNSTDANAPILVNNYDWMKDFSFIEFVRDVGKRITVNYMMSKDSVKKRIAGEGEGMSFTEFTYQLIQGYDFYHLHKHYNCLLQMGGSDQWGNITTGTELVRRLNVNTEDEGAKAFALTTPLITKADGSKFGKSEGGNVWLTADKTSPYKFYQFWFNSTDADAEKYIKIFTFLDKVTIEDLIEKHQQEPHLRLLQKKLAEEITVFVHSQEEYEKAVKASTILFGNSTSEDLKQLDEETFLDVFEGVPQIEIDEKDLGSGMDLVEVLSGKTKFLSSNSEARRALKENSISVNRTKVIEGFKISKNHLINNKFILLQRGKKSYFIVKVLSEPKVFSVRRLIRDNGVKYDKRFRGELNLRGFTDESKYRRIYKNEKFVVLPKSIIQNSQIPSSILTGFKIKTVIGGVEYAKDSCVVDFRGRGSSFISLPKGLKFELRLRNNDKLKYDIDLEKKEIILKM
ncbi:tyrosyl-tRNA synthetase [Flavobacterium lacus]|uniref:Tyrosine--tRNA ligase n=1 Tax=Flavobacterium lacus TaxID=1353778 RepID=A0A328WVZ3_9FLAO|nr:tyrosyl-tRNA synthetase [Flavobacterium lacus]